jgi:hypothetical protein
MNNRLCHESVVSDCAVRVVLRELTCEAGRGRYSQGMDAELAVLTTAAATTVVKLLASQGWQAARDGVVALWHRVHPDQAGRVGADLDESRAQLVDADRRGASDAVETALTEEWRGRLATLVTINPGLATELRDLLNNHLAPALGDSAAMSAGSIRLSGSASDHSTVIQAGNSVHIRGSLNRPDE